MLSVLNIKVIKIIPIHVMVKLLPNTRRHKELDIFDNIYR